MNKLNGTVVTITVTIVLLLLIGIGLFGGWGIMGPGMTLAPGASAGVGRWGFSPFGWIGMIFMWLIPVGLIALIVLGIVLLVRNLDGPASFVSGRACPHCGKDVQADWQHGPYCGTALK